MSMPFGSRGVLNKRRQVVKQRLEERMLSGIGAKGEPLTPEKLLKLRNEILTLDRRIAMNQPSKKTIRRREKTK